jgi:glutamate formiminotransferase/formiminotetrahydrofolate cyclodeaminase
VEPDVNKLVECVPNFSEGRDATVIRGITAEIEAVRGVTLLDVDPGEDTNRTVVTFVGAPEAVAEAAFRAGKRAAEAIDMAKHHGSHARIGAMDVCPFVPVAGVTMADCVALARETGRRIGELGIPVYLYEHAASCPARGNLAAVRAGEYEGLEGKLADPVWKPDFGPARHNPRTGAYVIGAREFLIAYNINLATTEKRYADDIAYNLRERGRHKRSGNVAPFYYQGDAVVFARDRFPCGACDHVAKSWDALAAHYRDAHGKDLAARYAALGYPAEEVEGRPVYADGRFSHVKAVGWVVEKYRRAQISINLTDFKVAPAHAVLEAAREEAAQRGIPVTGSEIVGMVPFDAMLESGRYYLRRMRKSTGLPVGDVIETAVQAMGLRDVAPFDTERKVLGMPRPAGDLVSKSVAEFVDEVSRDTPAPGGGSIAALSGSIGAALAAMVANLTVGKTGFAGRYEELDALAVRAHQGSAARRGGRGHAGLQRRHGRAAHAKGHAGPEGRAQRSHSVRLQARHRGSDADRPALPCSAGTLPDGRALRERRHDHRRRRRRAGFPGGGEGCGLQRAHQPEVDQGCRLRQAHRRRDCAPRG